MGRIVKKLSNKPILIAIVGKSASGKTYLMQELLKSNFKYSLVPLISSTTRPPREGEKEGEDYHFLSTEDFLEKRKQNQFLEWTYFNHWYYGHEKVKTTNKFVIGIFDPAGIKNILINHQADFSDIIVLYLDVNFAVRLERMIHREAGFKIEFFRRALTDFWNFRGLHNFLFKHKCWILTLEDYQTQYEKIHRIETMCSTVLQRRARLDSFNDYTTLWNG